MCDKIEAMDETYSQTFPGKLEQNFNIFVAKIDGCMAGKSSTAVIWSHLAAAFE